MVRKFFVIICLIFISNLLFCQGSGKVCFKLINSAVIKVDDVVLEKESFDDKNCTSFDVGIHTLEIWTPRFELIYDTINVVENESIVYSKALTKFNQEFLAHKEDYALYKANRSKKFRKSSLLFGAGALAAGTFLLANKSLRNSRSELKEFENEYYDGIKGTATLRAYDNYEMARKSHNKKVLLFGQIPLLATVTFNIWGLKNLLKNKKTPLAVPNFEPHYPW